MNLEEIKARHESDTVIFVSAPRYKFDKDPDISSSDTLPRLKAGGVKKLAPNPLQIHQDRAWLIEELERYRKLFSELQNRGGKSKITGVPLDAIWIDEFNWIQK